LTPQRIAVAAIVVMATLILSPRPARADMG
jgi:hypothetical protein